MSAVAVAVAVAVGQIRSGRLRYQKSAVSWEVLKVGERSATIREDGHKSTGGITIEDLSRWPCVGIVTPHGRVMVGERRQADYRAKPAEPVTVREYDGTHFFVVPDDGGMDRCWYSYPEDVVSWPIILTPTQTDAFTFDNMAGELRRCIAEEVSHWKNRNDPRERGPGLAALPPKRRDVRPDVVACERWERWSLP